MDSGAQVCFVTKKLANQLAPIGNGHNFKYIKVGKKLAKIQTYEPVKGNLPVTLANQETAIFTEYLPNVRVGEGDNEIAVNLWICPDSEDEEISLSKSVMHRLGFGLVNAKGDNIWDPKKKPVAVVEINYGESFPVRPDGELGSSDESGEEEKNPPSKSTPVVVSFLRPKDYFAKRVEIKKRHEITGHYVARIPCEIRDEQIKKGKTYVLEPNEILASDLELEITSSLAEAKEDGVLFM